jgi:hypothetical protein
LSSRVNGDNPIGAGPYTGLTTGTFVFIHFDDLELFIVHDCFELAGSLAGRIFALLARDRDIDAGTQLHHPYPGTAGVKGAIFCHGAPKLT